MHGFRLIFRHYGALYDILGPTPQMLGSFGVCLIVHTVLAEMLSHVLIGWGFITSLLDDIHVILRHIPYLSGSLGVCAYSPY